MFEGRPRQGKKLLPDWLSYLAGSSKSHREISISSIFLQSPHQVYMKNVVKWWKDFLLYFTTLETYQLPCKANHNKIGNFYSLYICSFNQCFISLIIKSKKWNVRIMKLYIRIGRYILYLLYVSPTCQVQF